MPSVCSQAFRGELVPQDEPASQLLHRIRTNCELDAEKKSRKKAAKKKPAEKARKRK